ncbi:hypothetical protein GAYE_PCTG71G1546 [Galdieria yellowstonensis]|uniref:Nudix hydrolase domain-containing protein n=1 Tax=Galdieria yellowstonensis TaxID=3028027 RepID=A0AAV9I8E8_9RHOD|nr:hypothetical protein GAYE_PCTG71G1546 [Galdieria yellowstonensis]
MGSHETLPDNFGKGGWKICFKMEPPGICGNGMLKISFHSDFNRKPHPDKVVEETIKDMWDRRRQANPKMWNALKFRVDSFQVSFKDGATLAKLNLGLTDYASYQGSSSLASPLTFFQSPEEGSPERHLPLALGNAGIVVTSDKYIILLERSEQVGEGAGRWVLPGGHPEPAHVNISQDFLTRSYEGSRDMCLAIERELYSSIVMEITEEVGLATSELSTLQLLGMVRRERDKRPVIVGHCTVTLSKSEMEARFCCQPLHTEACRILFCDLKNLESFLKEEQRLMPEHRGALQLYYESSVYRQDLQAHVSNA